MNTAESTTSWSRRAGIVLAAGLLRAALLAALWVLFTGWTAQYAVYGVVSVVAATGLSLVLLPPHSAPRPHRWPRRAVFTVVLISWFLGQSVRGGIDVALRAIKPTPDIAPAVVAGAVELPEGHARQLAMVLMNLMPGSMIQDGPYTHHDLAQVQLHTLSPDLDPSAQWSTLQHRVARAFD